MYNPQNYKADIISKDFHKNISYMSEEILTIDVTYPQIHLNYYFPAQCRINFNYLSEAGKFIEYALQELHKNAIESYDFKKENKFPFVPYEAVMNYNVTLNAGCLLSTFTDHYEFTGGAHGTTLRCSSTYELITGSTIKLEDLFNPGVNYNRIILDEIFKQADDLNHLNAFLFFENYKELIIKHYNPESFYLTPTGIVVYYQQYEVGPYASGIIEFLLSYESLKIPLPGCI